MRWAITTACLIVGVIGVALLAQAQNVDADRLPPGGRSILYIGVVIAWGFAAVGAYAHQPPPGEPHGRADGARRDDDRPDRAAVLRRRRCCSRSARCWTRSASRRWSTCCSRSRPAGGGPLGARRAVRRPTSRVVCSCRRCSSPSARMPARQPVLIEETTSSRRSSASRRALLFLFALVTTVVVLLRRRRRDAPAAARRSSPCCCSAR